MNTFFSMELLGSLAGIFTTFAFLPQVLHLIKTRSVSDISVLMYTIYCCGLALWVVYGIYLNALPIIVSNIITFVLALTILLMKIIWGRQASNPKGAI